MQSGKGAAAAVKEKPENLGSSAKAKASAEEKMERMRTHDLTDKEAAEQRKLEGEEEAEFRNQEERERHAIDREREQSRAGTRPGVTGHYHGGTGI